MPQLLYPEGRWKDIPKDFWSFEHQPDGVQYASYFFAHFTSRIGYTVGSTLTDPPSFVRRLNIPDEQCPAIVAFLDRHGFVSVNADDSLTLTERGEDVYGFITEWRQQMLWDIDEPTWREVIATIDSPGAFEERVAGMNEHHAPMMHQYAVVLTAEAVRERSAH